MMKSLLLSAVIFSVIFGLTSCEFEDEKEFENTIATKEKKEQQIHHHQRLKKW